MVWGRAIGSGFRCPFRSSTLSDDVSGTTVKEMNVDAQFAPGQRVRHQTHRWVGRIVCINAEASFSMTNQHFYKVTWDGDDQLDGLVDERDLEPE